MLIIEVKGGVVTAVYQTERQADNSEKQITLVEGKDYEIRDYDVLE